MGMKVVNQTEAAINALPLGSGTYLKYWHRENWTPDRADLQEFLAVLRDARALVSRRVM